MRLIFFLTLLVVIGAHSLNAQISEVDEKALTGRLEQHVSYLADDRLEGRETGSAGEKLAYEYIIAQFKEIGLKAAGSEGYLEPFEFFAGKTISEGSFLAVNGKRLNADEWYPLNFSSEGELDADVVDVGFGIIADDHDDYAGKSDLDGKIFLIDLSVPGGFHGHSKYYDYADARDKTITAGLKGASGVIFYTNDPNMDLPGKEYRRTITTGDIPAIVISLQSEQLKNYGTINNASLQIGWDKHYKTGHNVLGYIDNGAKYTVIIGAHYDHLGYGAFGSLYTGKPAIHNGADDNASGVAGLIELARWFASKDAPNNNYLFMAFSGEELGLFGSKSYTKSKLFNLDSDNYMINMDMIGRLDSTTHKLAINGVGTSPAWSAIENLQNEDQLAINTTPGGVGASDHTSFYLAGMPVLHFFTGSHKDYHKPSDDIEFINFKGMADVVEYIISLVDELDDSGKIAYTKTKEENKDEVPRFTVTLGVIPDYMYDGKGMRIETVREDRPASNAGIIDGDIVIKMGDIEVLDMMAYMKALSKFRKGDSTVVVIERKTEEKSETLSFDVDF